MTTWKDEFDKKFPTHQIYGDLDLIDIKAFIEKLIAQAKREVAQDFIMQCFESDNGNHIISTIELEQLNEKYK